jgi:hypothetical protein
MPGLVPGIHVLRLGTKKDVDGRDKPGHDEVWRVDRIRLDSSSLLIRLET